MTELLVLLVPLGVAYGWYMGRRSVRLEQRRRQLKNSESYVTGLNYLLADQSDKAIDLFIQAIEVDRQTIDTHFAVATLFRRRGELDRAIRLHSNLLARPSLPQEFRELAALELADDYLSAGVVDRAEQLLLELLDNQAHIARAGERLLRIYEQSHDWQRSLAMADKYRLAREPALRETVFHHQCERLENELASQSGADLSALLREAEKLLPDHPRLILLKANIAHHQHQPQLEVTALRRLVQREPDLAAVALPRLMALLDAAGDEAAATEFVQSLLGQGGATVNLTWAGLLAKRNGDAAAREFLLTGLRQRPNLRAFKQLVRLCEQAGNDDADRQRWQMIASLLEDYLAGSGRFQCRQCGFTSPQLLWHCPACHRWNTIRPKQGLEGE